MERQVPRARPSASILASGALEFGVLRRGARLPAAAGRARLTPLRPLSPLQSSPSTERSRLRPRSFKATT
jgi:hypothetical protein